MNQAVLYIPLRVGRVVSEILFNHKHHGKCPLKHNSEIISPVTRGSFVEEINLSRPTMGYGVFFRKVDSCRPSHYFILKKLSDLVTWKKGTYMQ